VYIHAEHAVFLCAPSFWDVFFPFYSVQGIAKSICAVSSIEIVVVGFLRGFCILSIFPLPSLPNVYTRKATLLFVCPFSVKVAGEAPLKNREKSRILDIPPISERSNKISKREIPKRAHEAIGNYFCWKRTVLTSKYVDLVFSIFVFLTSKCARARWYRSTSERCSLVPFFSKILRNQYCAPKILRFSYVVEVGLSTLGQVFTFKIR
jgi:hypothetical protein